MRSGVKVLPLILTGLSIKRNSSVSKTFEYTSLSPKTVFSLSIKLKAIFKQLHTVPHIHIRNEKFQSGTVPFPLQVRNGPDEWYRYYELSYAKFFKMDMLCKWAWLGTELLLKDEDGNWRYQQFDKNNIGVLLASAQGCIALDKKYRSSMDSIPSPALFVYTLPNIMLGELCIRHGFKGEQLCLIQESFDSTAMELWLKDGFENRGMEACLCGWVNATEKESEVLLFWITKDELSSETFQLAVN